MPNIVRLHLLAHTETNHATSLVVWNPTQARGFATVMDGTHTWWDGLVWEWPDPEIWPAGAELVLHPEDFCAVIAATSARVSAEASSRATATAGGFCWPVRYVGRLGAPMHAALRRGGMRGPDRRSTAAERQQPLGGPPRGVRPPRGFDPPDPERCAVRLLG